MQEKRLKELNKNIIEKKIGNLNKRNDEMEKSRMKWEKEVILTL